MHDEATMDALATTQEITRETRSMVAAIHEYVDLLKEPARITTIVLAATSSVVRDEVGETWRSIGLLNPTSAPIFLGIGGTRATAQSRAISAPPRSLLVLPVYVEDLEIGADPDDLADGDAVVFLLRFKTVQAAFLRSI